MFTIHYKLHFAHNLLFLSPIQAIQHFQEAIGNFFKTAIEAFYIGQIIEGISKAVSSTSSTPQSNVPY
jgi:hypothetical protein